MQNNRKENWKKLWREKGFYMVLTLCLAAAGISGVVFLSGAAREQQLVEETLAMPQVMEADDPETLKRQEEPVPIPEPEPEPEPAAAVEEPILPVGGIVVQDYAMDHLTYNRTTQDWRVHNGVDLAAPLGEDVKAAKSGTVTAVYEDEYLGTTVVLQHDGGFTTHYCNLALEPRVEAGEQVQLGQVLGQVGDTALLELADEPHLHFEVYRDGEPVNPEDFLW